MHTKYISKCIQAIRKKKKKDKQTLRGGGTNKFFIAN